MSEELRMWVEMIFNVSYLVVIWSMVVLMTLRKAQVSPQNQKVANRMRWAFLLLALGDTGHVGFRVVAYAAGGLEANPVLVGAGALSTAYTVTFFYMLMVDAWRLRFKKPLGWFGWLLLAAGVARLIVMAVPQNQWWQVTPPYQMSLFRNSFLVLQGLGIMVLILRDAAREQDGPFRWVGIMIAISYLFYVPVILFVSRVPMLGMLMIPKTCAYLGAALIAYRAFYPARVNQSAQAMAN
jgi:hypothetical protein